MHAGMGSSSSSRARKQLDNKNIRGLPLENVWPRKGLGPDVLVSIVTCNDLEDQWPGLVLASMITGLGLGFENAGLTTICKRR